MNVKVVICMHFGKGFLHKDFVTVVEITIYKCVFHSGSDGSEFIVVVFEACRGSALTSVYQ